MTAPVLDPSFRIHYRSRFKTDPFCAALFERAIAARQLSVHNARSVDRATSAKAQSIMRRFNVVPTWPTRDIYTCMPMMSL